MAGCGSSAGRSTAEAPLSTVAGSVAPLVQIPDVPTPTPAPTPPPPPPAPPVVQQPAVAPAAPDMLVDHLIGVGNARQVISVTASSYGMSFATLQAFTKTADGWMQTFGPWTARIGGSGFAAPGKKVEGDMKTPSGAYGFTFMFGIRANPGVRYEYRPVTGDQIVWNDDPSSANYNTWVDTSAPGADPGVNPEPMNNDPSYDYGAVIAYNTTERTPGAGSAIFFHQNSASGGSTAGCVSLPQSQLLQVLRWLDPAASPVIVMGTTAAVSQ